MIKIFEDQESLREHVNFVDDKNVFVGYDMSQQCCEYFTWYISKELNPSDQEDDEYKIEYPNHVFDVSFCETFSNDNPYNEGGTVVFKMINPNDENDILYLHLVNVHNGYYTHGFIMKDNEKTIISGGI